MGISSDNLSSSLSGLSQKRAGPPKLTAKLEERTSSESKLTQKYVTKDSKYPFQPEDFELIKKLGQGAGGTVSKVLYKPANIYMARKIIKMAQTDENQDKIEKQIMRELRIIRMCVSPSIVTFYGAFLNNNELNIMLELMDKGTLESIYQKNGPIAEPWTGKIAQQILEGLIYLFETHKIVHRDIKPANVLVASSGHAKLSDFGVSKETAETLAMTFIGTQCFLAPERIRQGSPCTPKSDVWALGLTLMEIAMAKFPFPSEAMNSYFDMMQYITQEQSPTLPPNVFSEDFRDFCRSSLIKEPENRPTPAQLMESPFMKRIKESNIDLKQWTNTLID